MATKANNTNSDYGVFLFLIWPFFAAIFAIRNYRAAWAKDLIWLFVAFFGFTLTIVVTDTDEKSDANRYRDKFVEMAAQKVSLENVTSLFYDEESQVLDVLESLIIFVVSRVSDNYHVLFAVFGLIFGFFYSRNIWYLIERVKGKMVSDNIPIILTFAFIVGFWEINGFRFWTATHIFLYGALPYLFEGKKTKIGFVFLAGLMHFSYILPIIILGIHTALGKRTNLYFIIFLLTFFIKELNLSQLGDFLSNNLPEIFLPRVKSYTNETYASDIVEVYAKANWYVVWYQLALKWSVAVFIITIFITGKKFLAANKNYENLFSFTLLLYSVANIFSLVPSGGRFLSLSNLFAIAFIFFYVQYAPLSRAVKRIIPFALPALSLYSIVSLRMGIEAMGILCLVGNPILRIFINADITVLEVLKGTFKF